VVEVVEEIIFDGELPVNETIPFPGMRLPPLLIQFPVSDNVPFPLNMIALPEGRITFPLTVSWAAPYKVSVSQREAMLRSPVMVGQLVAETGMITLDVDVGTVPVDQLEPVAQSVEVTPVQVTGPVPVMLMSSIAQIIP